MLTGLFINIISRKSIANRGNRITSLEFVDRNVKLADEFIFSFYRKKKKKKERSRRKKRKRKKLEEEEKEEE